MHIVPVDWDHPDAACLREAQRVDIDSRYGADTEPGAKPTAADVAHFVVAYADSGEAVGCGGLRQLDAVSGEIKRMYVVPSHRGTGVSGAVLSALEAYAAGRGWTHLRLETGTAQPEAVRFYTRSGYEPIPCFGAYAGSPVSLCFERAL